MVNEKNLTTEKKSYRAAVLEIIEFATEDIVTASGAELESSGKGENLSTEYDDFYWWGN